MEHNARKTAKRILEKIVFLVVPVIIAGTFLSVQVSAQELKEVSVIPLPEQSVRAFVGDNSNKNPAVWVTGNQILKRQHNQTQTLQQFTPQSDRVWKSYDNLIVQSVSTDSSTSSTIRWTIYSRDGVQTAEFSSDFPYDALMPQLYSDGMARHFAIVDPWDWTVTFYQHSSELKTVQLPAEQVKHIYETGYVAGWSADGTTFAFAAAFDSPESQERQVTFLLFGNQGNQLQQKVFSIGYVSGLAVSEEAQQLMLSGYSMHDGKPGKQYYLLSSDGGILHSDNGIALGVTFFGKNQAIVWGRRFIDAYEDIRAEPAWHQSFTSNKKTMCLDVMTTENGTIVLRGTSTPKDGEYVFTHPKVIWYDTNGIELDTFQFENEYIYQPFLHYNPADNTLRVGTADKIHTLKLVQ